MGCLLGKPDVETEDGRQFRQLERIGEGGFSDIFAVEDVHSHQKYALKRLKAHGAEQRARIELEIEALRDCRHVNILALECFTRSPENVYSLIFPLVKGGSIAEELAKRRPKKEYLSGALVLATARGIASALKIVHSRGYAHRDVKTANILIGHDERPLLIDFGSVCRVPLEVKDGQTRQKVIDEAAELCSMPFRAPELFTAEVGTKITESVDAWSFGCVLYALCHFASPFELVYEKGNSIALAVQSPESIPYPVDVPFDHRIFDLVRECLVVEPSKRPSMSTIEENLDEITVVDSEIV